ncbi:DUF302 domain-containing protein [Massilia endophytica]|uniref:DUF302 domain-containing protein n=1 Tax=Massilia endophytica TaxID=2899220 RepID=UPI001E3BC1D9|nr:DUF302 domain-containing protein [Massilia endophytica]UGQ48771.1 DUF302 domain-containing protein [Massilia endophytica]
MLLPPQFSALLLCAALAALSGCGTLRTMGKLEEGAGAEAARLWDRWIEKDGDIAAVTSWERKVEPGVTVKEVEEALASVAAEDNVKDVGVLPLSSELEARTGKPQRFLKVYSYCDPETARLMVDFSPHMAAFLPCRIVLLEKEDGLWLYTVNMDMLIHMGRKLPPELRTAALQMRSTIAKMLDRGARGEF